VVQPQPPRPAPPVDDPTGGRGLTARLKRAIPLALIAGLVIAVPLSIAAGEWRLAVIIPLALAGVTGGILAAIEDGRVQRRVNRARDTSPRDDDAQQQP
jgi:uncharacterized membrane protein